MTSSSAAAPLGRQVQLRDLRLRDLDEVVRIDALQSGRSKPAYWRHILRAFLAARTAGRGPALRIGLAAAPAGETGLRGYLLGEVRAFEFGSEPCGWVFAVGVDPAAERMGIASDLLAEANRRFQAAGIGTVRTMVDRDNVPVLAFFRANSFVGGRFFQLERKLP
jgi:ribosomal protein S18 acetylase RimI-like enzyme